MGTTVVDDLKLNYHIGKRNCPPSECEVVELIRTRLLRKGKGEAEDPIRQITQYWTLDGVLLWEVDPLEELRAQTVPDTDT